MATFIKPKIKYVHRDYIDKHQNSPVNIDLCTEIISSNEPNGYGNAYPIIEFKGCNVKWCYGEKGHKLRDEQYKELLTIMGKK